MLRLAFLIDRISNSVGSTAAMLVLPLGMIMTYEALARYTLNLPTFWAYELSYMLTGAHFALGIALVTRNNDHIRIDFLYSRMSVRVQQLLDLSILLFCMVPLITCVSFELIKYAWTAWVRGEVSGESGWNPLIWPVRSAIAFGFIMFSAQLISETIKTGTKFFSPYLKKISS
jgi:TRAP-type mannitol/chloroaromatic compound transport system permease small subunit